MRYKLIPVLSSLVGILVAWPVSAQEPAVTAFAHVAVIPMDSDRVLPDQTVLVQGNRILALGPASQVPVPAGARQIDGRGKFLMPGLGDMHSHAGPDHLDVLFGYLANGVTTLHLESQWFPTAYRERAARGELVPPRYFGMRDFPDCRTFFSLAECIAKMKATRIKDHEPIPDDSSIHAIARHAELGSERHPPPTLEEFEQALRFRWKYFDHLLTYLDYVIGYQLPWFYSSVRLDTAAWMQPGYRLDPQRLHHIVEATRRAGTWNTPTLVVKEAAIDMKETYPGSKRVMQRRFDFDLQIVKALSDAGAGLLLGTDADVFTRMNGFAVHRELQLLVQAGLTPYQALETGTRNVAVFTGTQDSAGTVAVGKYADLVLLEGNPLKDVRYAAEPAGVMFNGRWLSRTEIDARLDALSKDYPELAELRRAAGQHLGISQNMLYGPEKGLP